MKISAPEYAVTPKRYLDSLSTLNVCKILQQVDTILTKIFTGSPKGFVCQPQNE